jgi:hypothetical protein
MNVRRITLFFIVFTFLFCTPVSGEKKITWDQRHFPNAPRISAEAALKLLLAGVKMIIIDVPWKDEGYREGHICGAIKGSTHAKELDRLIKKIPKNYIILSYCK